MSPLDSWADRTDRQADRQTMSSLFAVGKLIGDSLATVLLWQLVVAACCNGYGKCGNMYVMCCLLQLQRGELEHFLTLFATLSMLNIYETNVPQLLVAVMQLLFQFVSFSCSWMQPKRFAARHQLTWAGCAQSQRSLAKLSFDANHKRHRESVRE